MRRLGPFALLAVLCLGCGDSTPPGAGTGLLVRVTWPPITTRWVPSTASRIDVAVLDALNGDQLGFVTIVRPDDSAKLIGLPPATECTVVATAYPDSADDPNQVAVASCAVQATVPEGAPEPLELVLSSTVSRIEITPSPAGMSIGSTVHLAATGRDAGGAAVLVDPDTWAWQSDAVGIAPVSVSGFVQGVSAGVACVTATFTPDDPSVAPGP